MNVAPIRKRTHLCSLRRLLPILALLLASGCGLSPRRNAGAPVPEQNMTLSAIDGWWSVGVKVHWPPDTAPRFEIDALLADQVFRPLILAHETALPLWRFHRRAARDADGHQFHFLFYASRETAAAIFRAVDADPLLKRLREAGVIDAVKTDDVKTTWRPAVSAMGDPHWSDAVNRAWPYFAMGVSKTWLSLVRSDAGTVSPNLPVDAMLRRYRTANDKVTAQWQTEGGHAFLHHLDALFGYEPLGIRF